MRNLRLPDFASGTDLVTANPEIRLVLNADVYEDNTVVIRKGPRLLLAGVVNSLWSTKDRAVLFFIKNGQLLVGHMSGAALVTTTLMAINTTAVSYVEVNNRIYLTSSVFTGYYNRDTKNVFELGVEPPITNTDFSINKEANFLFSYTYLYQEDDLILESGSSPLTRAVIPIASFTSTDARITGFRMYKSKEYGEKLFDAEGRQLKTYGFRKMPHGHIIRYHRGRLFVADTNILYFSSAINFNLYDPAYDFIQFESFITMVESIDDGFYVSTKEAVYYLVVRDNSFIKSLTVSTPAFFSSSFVVDIDALPSIQVNDIALNKVAVWFTQNGLMYGLPNGQIINAIYNKVRTPNFDRAWGTAYETNGNKRLLTTAVSNEYSVTQRTKNEQNF